MQPVFVTGQIVGLKADLNRQGPVIEILTSPAGRVRYRVFHGPGDVREYNEEQLIAVSAHAAGRDLNQILSPEAFLSAEEFHARLTAARLAQLHRPRRHGKRYAIAVGLDGLNRNRHRLGVGTLNVAGELVTEGCPPLPQTGGQIKPHGMSDRAIRTDETFQDRVGTILLGQALTLLIIKFGWPESDD